MAGGHHPRLSPLRTGLACRCPRCGQGKLFAGFLTLRDKCPVCGLDYAEADTGDGPAVLIIFLLGALVVPLALLFESLAEPPYWAHLVLWPPVILGGALALLRPMKATMVALQFHHRAGEARSPGID